MSSEQPPISKQRPEGPRRVPLPEGITISAQAEAFLHGRQLPAVLMEQTVQRPDPTIL
jgi:hypothetical protein